MGSAGDGVGRKRRSGGEMLQQLRVTREVQQQQVGGDEVLQQQQQRRLGGDEELQQQQHASEPQLILQANEEVLQQQQVRGPASLPTQPPTKATLLIEYIMLRGINDTQEDAHRCVWCVWCVWCVHGLCVCVYVYGCVCV